MAASIRNTPRSEILYGVGSVLNRIKQALNAQRQRSPIEQQIATGTPLSLGDLLIGQKPEALQDWSYEGSRGPISGRNIQTLKVDPRVIEFADILPVAPVATKAASHAAKAAAPIAAKQAVSLMEKYGVSPQAYIVKPEGNLNFTPRITADMLKGPEKQTAESFMQQIRTVPGVTKEGLAQIAAKYDNPKVVITKQQFEDSMPASQYSKIDLKHTQENAFEHYYQEAMQRLDPGQVWVYSGFPEEIGPDLNEIALGYRNFSDLDEPTREIIKEAIGINKNMTDEEISQALYAYAEEQEHNMIYDYATQLAETEGADPSQAYAYVNNQRLIAAEPTEGYFEFGVTHPDQQDTYRHYSSTKAPRNLIGHVRGTLTKEPTILEGGIEVPSNTYVIEEIQSDAQKGVKQSGPLHQAHGTLFKAAIQDALEKGADRIYAPTAYPIAKTRGRAAPDDYASIYDSAVVKEGIDPLRSIPGVHINPVMARHLNKDLSITDAPYYHEITIDPQAYEIITKKAGQAAPGYGINLKDYTKGFAAGGLVSGDYDDSRIDQLADEITNYAEGGAVEEEEESITQRIPRYVRKSQYEAAGALGLGPEVEYATEIPERYFPANEQHMGRGDAMRHLLLQAQLQQKWGDLGAYLIGAGHELFSGGQSDAEAEQDEYNDKLGRQIGRESKDRAEATYKALRAVQTGKARVLTKKQREENRYAEGGFVYDESRIDELANQLLGM